jgi:hypothetical protein
LTVTHGQSPTQSGTAYERVIAELGSVGMSFETTTDRQSVSQCPAHEDTNPSLVVSAMEGQALLYCRVGCGTKDVLDRLGMTMRDLFDDPRGVTYRYDDGRAVLKTPDKEIRQSGHSKGVVTLYRLAQVVEAVAQGRTIYLVEGEKDVHAIEASGEVGTTAPMGSSNFGLVDVSPLKGATVVAIPDKDAGGEKWTAEVRRRLDGYARSLTFRQATVGKDYADHYAAGGTIADLGEATVPDSPADARMAQLEALLVDSNGLEAIPEPEPIVDGVLYKDSLAWIFGAPASGKSFVALDIAGAVGGGHKWHAFQAETGTVLYLVAEGVSGVKRRVRAWEDYYDRKMVGVKFLPVAVQAKNATEWAAFVKLVGKYKPSMVIVDTQARVTEGMDENSNSEMGELVGKLEALRAASGACVLTVHHTGRNGEHMRGAVALDGAATTIIKAQKKKGDDAVDLECFKQKDAAPFDDIRLVLTSHQTSAVLKWQGVSTSPTLSSQAMHRALVRWWNAFGDTWATGTQLKSHEESRDSDGPIVAKTTFYKSMEELISAGTVVKDDEGRYPRYRLVRNPLTTVPDTGRTVPDSAGASGGSTVRTVPPPYRADSRDSAQLALAGTLTPQVMNEWEKPF